MRKLIFLSFFFIICFLGCEDYLNGCKRTERNYGKQVERIGEKFNLPVNYLKALIVLECSGRKKIPPRFEKHVFNKLQMVRDGKRKNYEDITKNDIIDASDEALKNLASSWGPFQLMGYKCVRLNLNIKDIRGDSSIYWGIKWIDQEYGEKLRKNKYEEAFRIHNTGNPNGKTYDPNYVKNGLKYIEYFN